MDENNEQHLDALFNSQWKKSVFVTDIQVTLDIIRGKL